jgi:hypothetical protein
MEPLCRHALAVIAGLAFHWFVPLPFLPAELPAVRLGVLVFALALALLAWASLIKREMSRA